MTKHDTKVLSSLIATTIDSARGYEAAADRGSDDRLKPVFDRLARERRETADRLKEVIQVEGTPNDEGTLKATAHRGWLDLKDAFTKGDRAVLNSVDAGEAYIREKYQMALKDKELSPSARNAVAEAFASVEKGKAEVSDLRRQCGIDEAPKNSGDWGKIGLGIGALAAVAGVALATSARRGASRRADNQDALRLRLQTDESMRMISSTKVEGTAVYDRDGEHLGKIASFMVDKYSGRVGYAVMTFGGTMGFGESLFPLPWSILAYDEAKGGYRLPIDKDDLASAPRFEASDEPEFSPEYRRQILVFYRAERSTTALGVRRPGGIDQFSRGPSSMGQSRGSGGARDRTSLDSSGRAGTKQRTGGDQTSAAERLAAGGTGQDLGQSGGSKGSFGSATGGSFGAPGGSDPGQL